MKRTSPWALVILVIIGSLLAWESSSGASDPAAHRRYERTQSFSPAWDAQCDSHGCEVPTLIEVRVATPGAVSEVDVVATLTLDLKTSAKDSADVRASFRRVGGGPITPMNPGEFPVASPRRFDSTTLVWVKRNLPAEGRDYTFQVSVAPRRGDRDPDVAVRGRKVSFVVELTRAVH